MFSYLEHAWYTYIVNGFMFHLTQKSVLLGCVLGRLTVTQEVWPTQTNAEFLKLVKPVYIVKVTTIVLSDTGRQGVHPWMVHGWTQYLWHPRIL